MILLCILDGWGVHSPSSDNAISLKAKHFKTLCETYSYTTLQASEQYVGLPHGQMGNSEVGHATIGLGRVIKQDLVRLDDLLCSKELFTHEAIQKVIKQKSPCHLMGLLSPGGVHSHQNHIFIIIEYLVSQKIPVFFHAFLDGRDTPPQSAISYLETLLSKFKDDPLFTLATLSGRYYAMDRDQRVERTKLAFQAIALGEGKTFLDPIDYIKQSYDKGISDEFIVPATSNGYKGVQKEDILWMANFRADRVRQILISFFDLSNAILGMNLYADEFQGKLTPLLEKDNNHNSLGEFLSQKGLKQLRISETEKYPHVTFFFNGGQESPFPKEDRIMIPSPKVATYDLCPEMSAYTLTDEVKKALGTYDLIVLNFANADMVGHTGIQDSICKAIEVVDNCVYELAKTCLQKGYKMIITADHGNAEEMVDHIHNQPHTAHTLNEVPFLIIDQKKYDLRSGGGLYDIAPTLLQLMNIESPKEMTGSSLIEKSHEKH